MLKVEQIKAARGLVEWTQDDLAKASGMSKPAINNIERRLADPRSETLASIKHAFENAGVEFIENGVKLNTTTLKVDILEGVESLEKLLNDILTTLDNKNETVMTFGIDEDKYIKAGGNKFVDLIKKREKLGIKTKLISCENDRNFIIDKKCYRWIPKEFFTHLPFYVYGNKYAIILWEQDLKIVLIQNKDIADSYKKQFMAMWDKAIIVD